MMSELHNNTINTMVNNDRCSWRSARESEIISRTHCSHSSSFSSVLLDAVYRSIDRGEDIIFRKPIITDADAANVRPCMIGTKKVTVTEKTVDRTNSALVSQADTWHRKGRRHNSSSSFSEYSGGGGGGGGFISSSSSSEAEPFISGKQSGLVKTKLRVLKMYGDLKKVKQPISPGGKLAGFLNSLFTASAGNSKKTKTLPASCGRGESPRSCLVRTPPSASSRAKRSVRFEANEDSMPRGQKLVRHENNNIDVIKSAIIKELMEHMIMKKNERGTREFESPPSDRLRKSRHFEEEEENDGGDDFDGASCASSDLFELDILTTPNIGMERYREELPVYETTRPRHHANRPIF